jgi:hypothetical protein
VYRRAVERVVAVVDAQEAGGELEGLLAEARHLAQRLPVGEGAVPVAVRDDVRGERRAESGDAGQQRHRGGIDVDADGVDAVLDDRVERLCQLVWLTSCWYWPTPIDLGSILTSSASGSCRRRAIETAPRRLTSTSGNSREAYSEAE